MEECKELVEYLKRKCSIMNLRYNSASEEEKKYYLPRKQWAEITLKELEHYKTCTNKNALFAKSVETKYDYDYLKKNEK